MWDALRAAGLEERHQLVEVDGRPGIAELAERGLEVRSMGRGPRDDPAFFLAAGAAGVLAARMAAGGPAAGAPTSRADLAGERPHMWAISCSTRSSTLRNGSLQSTVRCAWSFSFRCTQSTV